MLVGMENSCKAIVLATVGAAKVIGPALAESIEMLVR